MSTTPGPDVVNAVLEGWRKVAREHNLSATDVATIALMLVEATVKILSVDRADAMSGVDALTNTMRANLNKLYDREH